MQIRIRTSRLRVLAFYSFVVLPFSFLALTFAQAPTFRTGTTLIEFTFVARDSQGNPITDLTPDDIVVTEQGQPRKIEFFRFDGAPPQPAPNVLPPGHFTNRFETGANAARHITAILVDGMNTPVVKDTFLFTQATIRNQILAYLDGLPPHTRVGLFLLGRNVVNVLHDFTDDVASLRAQAAKMELVRPEAFVETGYRSSAFPATGTSSGSAGLAAGRAMAAAAEQKASVDENRIVQTRRVDLTLPALEAIGNHLARFPGRKNMIWVGNGMPLRMTPPRGRRDAAGTGETGFEARMRRTAQRLATQGVAIYPVASALAGEPYRESMNLFADVTGGRVTLTMNDPTEGLRTTALDQRAIYSVGFYAVAAPDNTWYPIRVQVRRPGVTVTHRQGYLSEAPGVQPLEWGEEEWRTALANPLGSSLVRLDGQFQPVAGAEPRTFDLRLQIALDDLHFRDLGGKAVAEVEIVTAEKVASGDFTFRVERASLGQPAGAAPGAVAGYSRRWTLNAVTTAVRLIVRDRASGNHGTLDLPVR